MSRLLLPLLALVALALPASAYADTLVSPGGKFEVWHPKGWSTGNKGPFATAQNKSTSAVVAIGAATIDEVMNLPSLFGSAERPCRDVKPKPSRTKIGDMSAFEIAVSCEENGEHYYIKVIAVIVDMSTQKMAFGLAGTHAASADKVDKKLVDKIAASFKAK